MTWPRKYDKFSPEQLNDWLRRNLNLDEMAAEAGTWPGVIRHAFRYRHIPYTPHRCRKSKVRAIDPELVRRLYDSGLTQQAIGARLGCCSTSVSDIMRANGIAARTHRGRPIAGPWHSRSWLAEQMLAKSYTQIAAEQGCHPQTIIKTAKRMGLIHDNHPRRVARRRLKQRIREVHRQALDNAPKQPPADYPDCPRWLLDIMAA